MNRRFQQNLLLIAFGVTLFAVLMHLGQVLAFFKNLSGLFLPVVVGFLLAFVLNVPLRGFERLLTRLTKRCQRQPQPKTLTFFSLLLTLASLALVIAVIYIMLVPELVDSVVSLYNVILEQWPKWVAFFQQYDIDISWITDWAQSLNLGQLAQHLLSGAGSLITSAVGVVSSTVSVIGSVAIALILAIYALLAKHDLVRQSKKLIRAHCSERWADRLLHVAQLINDTYSKFLSGQCLEAGILGVMIFLVLTILRVPYASLIGALTAVLAILPYVGSFLSCAIGVFLVLLAAPGKALICLIAYLVVQFVETQFIYPHVVGTSVGLSPMWTLIAVLIGGSLMGLFGMVFFIPLVAVVLTLLREHTNATLARKFPDETEPAPPEE